MFIILIVDDNHNNLFTLRNLIETHLDVEVAEADSGEQALTYVLDHKVDLIILDVQMPEMDGFEVAQGLQSLQQTRHIPIVFLTAAYKSEEFQQRGFAIGAADYLTKPIDAPQLISRIKVYLRFLEKDREHHRELERKVHARTIDLRQMRDQLEIRVEQRTAELQQAKQEMRLLLESSGEGICGLDSNGTITFINPAAAQMLGYTYQELLGKSLHHIAHYQYADEMSYATEECALLKAIAQSQSEQKEAVFWHKEGHPFPVSYLLRPMLEQGKTQGAVLSFLDITEQQRVQQDLQEAKDAAEQANLAKSQFMANMSHELRTPLNAIIGYSEMLMEDIKSSLGEGQTPEGEAWQQWLNDCKSVVHSGQHLLSLVNDVLDLSKIEAGKMTFYYEDFSLYDMLSSIKATLKPLAKKNHNELSISFPSHDYIVNTDLTKVRQALFNLLSNACKFTENGNVMLQALCQCEIDEPRLVFQVEDTGIGMPPQQLSKIFQPFIQADNSTTRKYGGTGLGLAITRHFIEMLGGSIQVHSEVNQGTSFIIKLPIKICEKNN